MGRFITDPIWWLYMFWLPSYLQEARGLSLQQVGQSAWVPFLAGGVGALSGGYASGALISRGWTVDRARKAVMIVGAMLTPAGILAMRASDPYVCLGWMAVVLFGFQVWVNNLQTLAERFLPEHGGGFGVRTRRRRGGAGEHPVHVGHRPGRRRVRLHAGVSRCRRDGAARTRRDAVACGPDPHGIDRANGADRMTSATRIAIGLLLGSLIAGPAPAQETIPAFDELLAHKVALKPELVGVHPRVFVTKAGLDVASRTGAHDPSCRMGEGDGAYRRR